MNSERIMDSGDGGSGSGSVMGFPHEGGESAINPMSSMPLHTSNASVSLFSTGWDPISSLSHSQNFGCSPSISNHQFLNYPYPSSSIWENQGISSSSCTAQLPHYQLDSNFVGFPGHVIRGYSEIANSICPMNYDGGSQARTSMPQELKSSEEEAIRSPSNAKRKRTPDKNNEGDLRKDPSGDTSDVQKEQSKKKQRTELAESADSRGKQSTKQAKEDSNSGGDEQPKEENYLHMRARRGQATNSHSLAERVRREKISERMRLLQDLVPGCNKITGKAVMLDEIINYVQSLQQQVEFLSMKLSTLVPDLSSNNNLESILSKEVLQLQSHGRDAILHGLGSGLDPSLPYGQRIFHYPHLPRAPLDTELQALLQMGFDSSAAIDILKTNARLKSEQ